MIDLKGARRTRPIYERAMIDAENIDHEVCVHELFTFVTK